MPVPKKPDETTRQAVILYDLALELNAKAEIYSVDAVATAIAWLREECRNSKELTLAEIANTLERELSKR